VVGGSRIGSARCPFWGTLLFARTEQPTWVGDARPRSRRDHAVLDALAGRRETCVYDDKAWIGVSNR